MTVHSRRAHTLTWCLPMLLAALSACSDGDRAAPAVAATAAERVVVVAQDDIGIPWGPEFEIDADADHYFGALPMTVTFTARPLNGTPPYTFSWDFGDGSPAEAGERVSHVYKTLGRVSAFATGRDASGQSWQVQLGLLVVTAEEYARRKQPDNGKAS